MRWFYLFAGSCIGLILLALALAWMLGGFTGLGVSGHGVIAITLTIVLTVLVAVGLMGLVFYSSRSGRDVEAHYDEELRGPGEEDGPR